MAQVERGGIRLVVENYEAFTRELNAASASMGRFGQQAQQTASQVNAAAGEYRGSRVEIEQWSETVDTSADDAARAAQAYQALSTTMLALGAAGKVVAIAAALQAARVQELEILLEVTRENAIRLADAEGEHAKAAALTTDAVQEQVQGIRDLHLAGRVANSTVAALIRYNLDWTRATELARLAQDAATFAMKDSSDAVQGLIHGITTLQPRILRTYGLMINLNEAYRRYAEANDVVAKNMTIAQRQQAAFQEVLRLAPTIAGAYEASLGSMSKQLRSVSTDVYNLAEAFGEHLTPVGLEIVQTFRGVLKTLTALPDPIQATVIQSVALNSGLLILAGTLLKARAALLSYAAAATTAGTVTAALKALILGPAGLVFAVGALITLGLHLRNVAKANQEEAAAILDSSKTYADYTAAIEHAGLEVNELSEDLYEMARAAKKVNEEFDALEFQKAADDLDQMDVATLELSKSMGLLGDDVLDDAEALDLMLDQVKIALPALSDLQIEILLTTDYLIDQARELGLTGDAMVDYVRAVRDAAEEEKKWRLARAPIGEHEEIKLGLVDIADATNEVAAATLMAAEATDMYVRLTEGGLERASDAWADLRKMAEEGLLEAAEKSIEIEQKADDKRWDARRKLIDSLNDLERKHARALEEIYEDIAQINIDLQNDILEAEREAAQDRLELQQELARDLADLDRELAQDLADLARDRQEALADAEREYHQDRADAYRDLTSDLADLERDLAKEIEEIRADHLQDLLDLEADFAQQREDLLADFAQRAEDIEAKYSLEPPEPTIDELREALQEELKLLQEAREEQHGVASRREKEILAELEALKEKELAQLEEDKQEQLDLLDAQLEEEKAARDEAYQKELEEAKAAYEEQREERLRQYQEKLSDLEEELRLEKEAIQTDYNRRYEDLHNQHIREREEILRRHREALDDLDAQLRAEKERLDTAAKENRDRLAQRLQDEKDNYDDRQEELLIAWQRRIEEIERQYAEEQGKLDDNLVLRLLKEATFFDDLDAQTKADMQDWVLNSFAPGLDDALQEFIDFLDEMDRLASERGFLGDSPAPWWRKMAESWSEGIEKGFDLDAANANIASAMGDLQMQIQTAVPTQQAALPMGVGSRNYQRTDQNTLNVTAQYQQHQSEASLRDDLSLWNGMMRAWGR